MALNLIGRLILSKNTGFLKFFEKSFEKILPCRGKGVILHSLSGTTGHDSEGNGSGKVIEILANKTKVVRRNKVWRQGNQNNVEKRSFRQELE